MRKASPQTLPVGDISRINCESEDDILCQLGGFQTNVTFSYYNIQVLNS
jgi:hypothetical protein